MRGTPICRYLTWPLLAAYWLPILLVCVFLTLATVLLCFGFGRLLGDYGVERSLTMYGCCCGSTGSGIVLLRILDPDLSTPIARELAFFNVVIIFLSFHILGLTAPFLPTLSPAYIYTMYGGTFVVGALVAIFGFRSLLFLTIEVAFLIGAGIYADEMNFQTLNISLLCIAFGVGMRRDLFYLCIALLLIDTHGISEFVHEFF